MLMITSASLFCILAKPMDDTPNYLEAPNARGCASVRRYRRYLLACCICAPTIWTVAISNGASVQRGSLALLERSCLLLYTGLTHYANHQLTHEVYDLNLLSLALLLQGFG